MFITRAWIIPICAHQQINWLLPAHIKMNWHWCRDIFILYCIFKIMTGKIVWLLSVFALISVSLSETPSCPQDYLSYFTTYQRHMLSKNSLTASADIPLDLSLNRYNTFLSVLDREPAEVKWNCIDDPPVPDLLSGAKCPWKYVCDYNPLRFPQAMYNAQCINDYWYETDSDGKLIAKHQCKETTYAVPTLKTTDCDPLSSTTKWKWQMEMVKVSCIVQ